jgi:hypothetical protein
MPWRHASRDWPLGLALRGNAGRLPVVQRPASCRCATPRSRAARRSAGVCAGTGMVVSWTSTQPRSRATSIAQRKTASPRPLPRRSDRTRTASIWPAPRRAGRDAAGTRAAGGDQLPVVLDHDEPLSGVAVDLLESTHVPVLRRVADDLAGGAQLVVGVQPDDGGDVVDAHRGRSACTRLVPGRHLDRWADENTSSPAHDLRAVPRRTTTVRTLLNALRSPVPRATPRADRRASRRRCDRSGFTLRDP